MRFFPFCVYILIADFIFVAATCSVQYLENSHLNAPVGVGRTSHAISLGLKHFLVTKVTKHCMANGMICGSIKGTCTVMCHCHKQQRRKAKAHGMKIMYQCVFDVLLF